MRIVRIASQIAMSAGLIGLVMSFTVLIRDRWGAGFYLILGLVLLAVGALFFWITSRKTLDSSADRNTSTG